MTTRKTTQKAATNRKAEASRPATRVPVSGNRDIMTVFNKDPNFHYRWVNDVDERGSRIMKFERGGYHFAPTETDLGDKVIGDDAVYKSKLGDSIIRLPTGNGGYSYLMRIKREWYDEDDANKNAAIDVVEGQITGTGSPDGEDFGQYGSVSIRRD